MTEDDTFKALLKVPFETVLSNVVGRSKIYNRASIIKIVATHSMEGKTSLSFENMYLAQYHWTYQEFGEECKQRHKNA
jgi:hypothetical protein